jgi:predicted dehydrogenase/threonine dehydrogenase-like Zn-dependent dehydrogenase
MKQVFIRQGQAVVEDVAAPEVSKDTILVQVMYSCISVGTEMSGVRMSGAPLWKRALQQPEQVKMVLEKIATEGLARTKGAISRKLAEGMTPGYSAAGIVLAIGENIIDIRPGDRVACAGAGIAPHAEVIRVPRNLAVPVPDGLECLEASTVTLGAIALQGVRRASPTLGESFIVIGLGFLGQLTCQMLKANGCRVVGIDLDRSRIQMALKNGVDVGLHPDDGDAVEQVFRLTEGIGADGVIVTAATPSDEVLSTAFRMCRKKGRVVLVGDVGLNIQRSDIYQKELDFFISTSYGPGRYDNSYEEEGTDYPVAYVRWTENRNMNEYLRQIAAGSIKLSNLISDIYGIFDASSAYEALKNSDPKPMMLLLRYPQELQRSSDIVRAIPNPSATSLRKDTVRIAVIGAGGFAKGVHLPNITSLPGLYHLGAIVSGSGSNAKNTANQFGADFSSTDYSSVLNNSDIDAVLICTRHNSHGDMVLQALNAGKHVLVEKPLTLSQEELKKIILFYDEHKENQPILLTGFNRRFSPHAVAIKEILDQRSNPIVINYRMNAGYIPLDHWVHTNEGGGRNIGEACHIYDLFTYFIGSKVVEVSVKSISPATSHYSSSDNFVATMSFEDGSVATLTYTALGHKSHPKETVDFYVDGKVLSFDDYMTAKFVGDQRSPPKFKRPEKGQLQEIKAFALAIQNGGKWPIELWEQVQATNISFVVESKIHA